MCEDISAKALHIEPIPLASAPYPTRWRNTSAAREEYTPVGIHPPYQ
jgi:hypothetical protein